MTYTGSAHSMSEFKLSPELLKLIDAVNNRSAELTGDDGDKCIGSQLPTVNRAFEEIQRRGLPAGNQFCDWGSGLGGVCGVAALNGFKSLGIEFHHQFVVAAREIAESQNLPITYCEGTFFVPGDETLSDKHSRMIMTYDKLAWEQTELSHQDIDVVFSYPWPGEEGFTDRVFLRHAKPGTLLVTFHGCDQLLVQRKTEDQNHLEVIDWM